jgi:D-aspartate ligase
MSARLVVERQFARGRPPVLLLAGPVLVRTLGIAGIPLIVASSDATAPAFFSRYCSGRCVLASKDDPDALLCDLLEVGDRLSARFGRRVPLMCGDDFFLEFIVKHRQPLAERFLFLLPDPLTAEALLAKDRFQEFAHELGLPVPRSVSWESLAVTALPVLAKPRSKARWRDSELREHFFIGDSKAVVFPNGREATLQPLIERNRSQLMFQEYVCGDDRQLWSYHGFASDQGKILASFLGRKLRTSPPVTGESAFIELMHDDEHALFGRQLAERIPLKGPFKIDFKTDSRTGSHVLLEINARFNLWHYLGAVNGINLMQIAYDYLLDGREPGPRPYSTSKRWLCLRHDFRAYRAMAALGELSFVRWIASILSTNIVYNVFAWNDPAPLLVVWRNRFARKTRKALALAKRALKR